jgi:hypothetical protein
LPANCQRLNWAISANDANVAARAMTALAPLLPLSQLRAALPRARVLPKDYYSWGVTHPRAEALLGLAPHLPEEERRPLIRELLDDAKTNVKYGLAWIDEKGLLTRFAEIGHLGELIDCVNGIEDSDQRIHAQKYLLPHLPKGERKKTLEAILDHVQTIDDRDIQKAVQATYLMVIGRVQEGLEAARSVKDDIEGAAIAQAIAERGCPKEALAIIGTLSDHTIDDGASKTASLIAVAEALSEPVLPDALRMARGLRDPLPRCNALLALSPRLNPAMKVAVVQEVVETVRGIEPSAERAKAFVSLSPGLQAIVSGAEVDRSLMEPFLREALDAVRALEDSKSKAEQLVSLSKVAAADERHKIFQEVIRLGSSVKDNEKLQVAAVPAAIEYIQASYSNEVVAAAGKLRLQSLSSDNQAYVIRQLASSIPDPLLSPIFATADSWTNEREWALALESLSRWLAKGGHPQEALALSRAIRYRLSDIRLLAMTWALPVSSKTDKTAIIDDIVRGIGYISDRHFAPQPGNRQKLLSTIAPYLQDMPYADRYAVWCKALAEASLQTRKKCLWDLRVLPDVIQSLGGKQALLQTIDAINDVGRWFP